MKEDFKYTEKYMQDCLETYYYRNVDYYFRNIFLFDSPNLDFYTHWESDFLIIRPNGYITDYEIKVSKSDYLQEFKNKPKKHEVLQGKEVVTTGYISEWTIDSMGLPCRTTTLGSKFGALSFRPNNFVFVTPPNLITLEELPEYAGLIEINHCGQLEFKKKPPFLHKEKIDYKTSLFNKCYHKWRAAENNLALIKEGINPEVKYNKEVELAKKDYHSALNQYRMALRVMKPTKEMDELLDMAYNAGYTSGILTQLKNR